MGCRIRQVWPDVFQPGTLEPSWTTAIRLPLLVNPQISAGVFLNSATGQRDARMYSQKKSLASRMGHFCET
jgi:hypothetical protein